MINLFQYDFVIRGLTAGLIIAIIAPIVGIFLVLRRYSLIADTLSHVSLAGIAFGLLLGFNPLLTAIGATTVSSIAIERLRLSKKVYGESALALFLSGSLAVAVILISISHGFNSTLFNYLFGSIATVTQNDIYTVLILGIIVVVSIVILYKKLLFITFDEDAAKVDGINVSLINTIFIILAAITISLAIPIVGILLISALLIIPVLTALQFKKSFIPTILIAQAVSVFSVITGVVVSFYFDLAPGGTIVLLNLIIFLIISIF
ncbi:MAG TPA: metal ABC transporter permease [Patescibacteria group bacterium]|nr:metal ABC transporter permease [Patescibacteria group bacterium]